MKLSRVLSPRRKFTLINAGVFLYLFFLFNWLRGSAIASLGRFNPDEAELLAGGLRAAKSFIPFKDFTSPTFGPIWPLFLGYLHRFGLPLNLPVAHFLSALILILICKFIFDCSVRRFSVPIAIVVMTPFALQFATGLGDFDYLSLSTELLPLLFLVIATTITFRQGLSYKSIFIIGLFFGLAVFSKYFFAPLAFIGMVTTLWKARSDGVRWVLILKWMVIGFLLPITVLMSWALVAGVPVWKIIESPMMTLQYLHGGGLGNTACTDLSRLNNIRSSLTGHSASLSLMLLGISLCLTSETLIRNRQQLSKLVLLVLPPIIAIFLLSSNCTIFPHYNYLLVGGILQSFIASCSMSKKSSGSIPKSESRTILFLFAFVIAQISLTNVTQAVSAPLVNGPEKISQIFSASNGFSERAWDAEGIPLSSFCKRGDSVLVWGWSPELYSFYDWEPASRYVTTTLMMDKQLFYHDTKNFRKRFSEELQITNLDCVIVSIGPSFFGSFVEADSMKVQMPALWNRVTKHLEEKTFYWDSVNPVTILVPRQKTASS